MRRGVEAVERWLVVSNCQTVGVANCIQAQAPDVSVVPLDPGKFNKRRWRPNAQIAGFDRLLIYPPVQAEMPRARMDRIATHIRLPIITFRAYHPDLIYLHHRGRPLGGPISHYHSAIAFACYLEGIGAADAIGYFNGGFYERCGYLGLWDAERDRLLGAFAAEGLDIRPYFRDWGRRAAFMYSYNHPRIRPLYDMASAVLAHLGMVPRRSDLLPHDNLANSAIFPVYPEIGETLGVYGQSDFRPAGTYRSIPLRDYVDRCFALYATLQMADTEPFHEFREQVRHIRTLL
ncbi:WcbI family polysaccharide biosynthesis putative acetyltransferase [Croceibacterium sp. TMG7-5b_MA50]|uniref:WcbI family polysaccharide biosynthesis putative acetyltransferase n=1 Tax=Croceibacterium sp. TMG7-5b_MA50 TaxID=3121290 RepID=UPI003221FF84